VEVRSLEACPPSQGTLATSVVDGKFSLGFRILIKCNKSVVKLIEQIY